MKLSDRVSDGEWHDFCDGRTDDLAAKIAELEAKLDASRDACRQKQEYIDSLKDTQQDAINAALESIVDRMPVVFDDVEGVKTIAGWVYTFINTNPLALLQARLDHEAQGHAEYRVKCEDLRAKLAAAEKDAARFQFWADNHSPLNFAVCVAPRGSVAHTLKFTPTSAKIRIETPDMIREAIDAAMEASHELVLEAGQRLADAAKKQCQFGGI